MSQSGNVWEDHSDSVVKSQSPIQSANELESELENKIEQNRLEIKAMAEKLMKEH